VAPPCSFLTQRQPAPVCLPPCLPLAELPYRSSPRQQAWGSARAQPPCSLPCPSVAPPPAFLVGRTGIRHVPSNGALPVFTAVQQPAHFPVHGVRVPCAQFFDPKNSSSAQHLPPPSPCARTAADPRRPPQNSKLQRLLHLPWKAASPHGVLVFSLLSLAS
jgi:hypothetical protein